MGGPKHFEYICTASQQSLVTATNNAIRKLWITPQNYCHGRNVKVKDLADSAIYKLRKHIEQVDDGLEDDEEVGDDFENLYKGEISKSGAPILPSKRARKIPEKIQVSKDDLAELSQTAKPEIETSDTNDIEEDKTDISLEDVSESENKNTEEANTENSL